MMRRRRRRNFELLAHYLVYDLGGIEDTKSEMFMRVISVAPLVV